MPPGYICAPFAQLLHIWNKKISQLSELRNALHLYYKCSQLFTVIQSCVCGKRMSLEFDIEMTANKLFLNDLF